MSFSIDEFTQLHDDIIAGEASPPSKWTRRGRAYHRWLKHNEHLATQVAQRRRKASGVIPVRYEHPFGAIKARGYTDRAGGYAAVQSGPEEWQTTTNLGCGFNPNVVGAPAPVIGTPCQ